MPVLNAERPVRVTAPPWLHPAVLLAISYACLLALHAPLLRLPYFWDEAGYYIPAARDLLLNGSLIPRSTMTNAHPPLVMAFLAAAWKLFGYSPLVTRCAMLLVASFGLLGVFRLARHVASIEVAIASVICTALYPVYFAQSSLAHIDLAAAALIVWGLDSYLRGRRAVAIAVFAIAALTKETAVIVPVTLFAWESVARLAHTPTLRFAQDGAPAKKAGWRDFLPGPRPAWKLSLSLLLACVPAAAWFGFHYVSTGHVFGNPQYFHYNVAGTLNPVRIAAALALRIWQLFGYLNMSVVTAAMLMALTLPPRLDRTSMRKARGNGDPRVNVPRIALPVQAIFGVLVAAHALMLSLVGGAVLARYLLPVYPLVIIVAVSTLRRRLLWWPAFVGVICIGFVIALISEPPYRFAPEDNLAYADYVGLHESASRYLEQHFADTRVLTAWPASDELMRPWLGYVNKPVPVLRIENFSVTEMLSAAEARSAYKVAYLFSTKEEPRLLFRWAWWERMQTRFFDYHQDLRPGEAARLLGGRVIFEQHRRNQWVAVVRLETVEEAGGEKFKFQAGRRVSLGEYPHCCAEVGHQD